MGSLGTAKLIATLFVTRQAQQWNPPWHVRCVEHWEVSLEQTAWVLGHHYKSRSTFSVEHMLIHNTPAEFTDVTEPQI